ncbi:peptidase inhibitor family I36 protein [Streptomyces liangshanensis]|uniref:peptidase inhibitor family I36 protein n=1 Tax=Streptomyces liangshanensis TaxID=2717324 RepID=UPI0036DA88BF
MRPMRMTRRALAAAGLAFGLVALSFSPAQAATWYFGPAPAGCQLGALCVYKDINFEPGGWGVANFHASNVDWTQTSNAYIAGNDSSWFNNGTPGGKTSVIVMTRPDLPNSGSPEFCLDRGWGNTWDIASNDGGRSNRWVFGPC